MTVTVALRSRGAFTVLGRSTWISGQEVAQFGAFWQSSAADGLLIDLERLRGGALGPVTEGVILGVSRVEADPANRSFAYMIAIESERSGGRGDLERYQVPAAEWAVFSCPGPMPEALVTAERYAFEAWLPASGYRHASAPELEVYLPDDRSGATGVICEFWLPVEGVERGA